MSLRLPGLAIVPAVVLALVAPAPAPAGDATVARTLLDAGKKAFNAKKYEEALPLFRKAATEDSSLIEAVCWTAQALEKAKDEPGALAAYRDYLALFEKKAAAGGASPEEQKLKALAEKHRDALAVAEREFQKFEEKYVADLLALARDLLAKGDPGSALRAAELVLEVAPKHPEASALRERLGGGRKGADPSSAVATWKDLLKDRCFNPDVAQYAEGRMSITAKAGGKLRSNPPVEQGGDFVYEAEFRVAEGYEQNWIAGLMLGDGIDGACAVGVHRAKVEVAYWKGKPAMVTPLASFATAAREIGEWHRLLACARGTALEVWLDGAKVLETKVEGRLSLAGELGLWLVGCRTEFRVLRAGGLP